MSVRPDYYYPNIERSLIGIVDLCVSSIFHGGAQVYTSKKDFIVKAIQNQIESEAKKNKELATEINKKVASSVKVTSTSKRGGNRIHVKK